MTALRLALAFLWLGGAFGADTGSAWTVETIDAVSAASASVRIAASGDAHAAYVQTDNHALRYAFWDHALRRWFATTVDSAAMFSSLAVDSRQRPHISYLDYGTGKVKYAYWDGSAWRNQTIEVPAGRIAYYTCIAVDPDDHPTIGFYEYIGLDTEGYALRLRTVKWNGSHWELRTVDATRGSGKFNDIAIDSKGGRHVAYANVDYGNASLRYAYSLDGAWKPEIIGGVSGENGVFSTAITVDSQNVPHISSTHVQKLLVQYTTRVGDRWKTEAVAPIVRMAVPDRNGIALDDQGRPYISYFDAGAGTLNVAHKTAAGWVREVVDTGGAGLNNSLQFHNGELWIVYTAPDGLRAARRKLMPEDSAR